MKTSFWRRWLNSLRGAKPTGQVSRARPRRTLLCLEALEDRVTPSLTPQMVLDINPNSPGSNPSEMVAIGSTAYFTADDGVHGVELWKSDGTAAGTTLVKEIYPGSYGSGPTYLTNVNGTLFFRAGPGSQLWKSDGTEAGTTMVSSLALYPSKPINVNGTLFFAADDANGRELWKSDGTEAGTTLVKDIYPGDSCNFAYYGYYCSPNGSFPSDLTNVNGMLFFSADDGTDGRELWKSDGTAAGTTLVTDLYPGGSSYPRLLTNVNGTLFFKATDATNGRELWRSDGTAAGTTLVKDIGSGALGSSPYALGNVNGMLFFSASDSTNGRELWTSDGTAAGTILVKDINPGSASSSPTSLTNVNGTLFFTANDGTSTKLWQSDGTPAGTVLVANLSASNLTNVNGTLFFAADDGIHGMELWTLVNDGQSQGTSLEVSGFPATITAGVAGNFTITAQNADGTTNSSYRGTVHFTSSDLQAVLPGDYTFTAADNGVHTFSATLKTAGSQSITVSDTGVPVAGTQAGITVNPAAASNFTVAGFPSPVTAGVIGSFTVTAWDPYGNRATGYRGTVRFTSSDPQAALPGPYTFTAADAGTHTFSATLKTAGYQSLTATDTVNAALTAVQGSILVNAAAASRLVLSYPSSVKANTRFSLTVTVVDAYGNVVTGYTGTLSFSSSDSSANLPRKYTFSAADQGVHTFTGLVLKKKGKQTITVTDSLNSSLTGSALIDVL